MLGLSHGLLTERKGQRREPATRGVRIATRRAGWRPFAEPSWLGSFRDRIVAEIGIKHHSESAILQQRDRLRGKVEL